jgi:hypothetical protein
MTLLCAVLISACGSDEGGGGTAGGGGADASAGAGGGSGNGGVAGAGGLGGVSGAGGSGGSGAAGGGAGGSAGNAGAAGASTGGSAGASTGGSAGASTGGSAGSAGAAGGTPTWDVTSALSSHIDYVTDNAVDASGAYFVGTGNTGVIGGTQTWAIEKRDLLSGAELWTKTNWAAWNQLQVDASGLCVAGSKPDALSALHWTVAKLDLASGDPVTSFGTGGEVASDGADGGNPSGVPVIALDAGGLYLAGKDAAIVGGGWRVEKRSPASGALVASFGTGGVAETSNLDQGAVVASTVDATHLYLLTRDRSPGTYRYGIEKRDKVDGSLVNGFGTAGYAVIVPAPASFQPAAMAMDGTRLYVAGTDSSLPGNDWQWRVQAWDKATAGALWNQTSNPSTPNSILGGGNDSAFDVAVGATGVFVVGERGYYANHSARVEKRDFATGTLVGSVLVFNPTGDTEYFRSVVVSSGSLYLGGAKYSSFGNHSWWMLRQPEP